MFRDARVGELEALSELCLRSKAHWGYSEEFMSACRPALTVTPTKLQSFRVRVAEVDGRPAAVSALDPSGEVDLLFVDPPFMGRGIGRAAMTDLKDAARAQGLNVLWILADPDAEKFYSRQGALTVAQRNSDVIPGRQLPWMRLWLGGPPPTLTSERLRLRPWTGDDRDPLARLHSDRRVSGPLGGDIDRASSDAFIVRMEQSFERYGFGFWAVEYDRLLIGAIGLAVPRFDAEFTPCVEVGWRLSVEHWGAGFATEGAHAALHYAFDALQLDEVVSFTAKSNVRSQRVMERLGLLRDRDFLHPLLAVDHPLRPHVLYRGRRYSRE